MKKTRVIIGGQELFVPDFDKKYKYFDGDVVKKRRKYLVLYHNKWYKIPKKQTITKNIIYE